MTYHDSLQPLAHFPLSECHIFDLLPQQPRLIAVAAHLGLSLLAAEHGALQGGVGSLALQALGLHGQRVELVDLLVDRAVAIGGALGKVDAARRGEQGRLALGIVR